MAERCRDFGMDRVLSGKIAAKYDAATESTCRQWIHQLTGEDTGEGRHNVEKALKNGIVLCKLAQRIYDGTPNLPEAASRFGIKYNTMSAPFKQMENIEIFLKACEYYGVPRSSLFQVVDLYEGRNMAAVLACLLQLGTECQRHGFNGPTIGTKPVEKHLVQFSEEQMRAGQCIIGLQAGTNKCASQSGMNIGGARHIADIKVERGCREGEAVIGLQAGSNKGASQSGMMMGGVRHIADIKVDNMSADSNAVIGLQAGSNKGASQSGMSFGASRHIADLKIDAASPDGQAVIGLQMGSNQGASQAGMSFGKQRHITDM